MTNHGAIDAVIGAAIKAGRVAADEADVNDMVSGSLVDSLTVIIDGFDELSAVLLLDTLSDCHRPQPVSALIPDRLGRGTSAALFGTAGHAKLFDDTNLDVLAHLGVPVVAALLGSVRGDGLSGSDWIASVACGFELALRIGSVVMPTIYESGFHTTGVLGAIAAAGAVAYRHGDPIVMRNAVGIGASLGAGLRANFPSNTMALHAGNAAGVGATAADLAARGFTSAPESVFGDRGFVRAYGGEASLMAGQIVQAQSMGTLLKSTRMLFKEFRCGAPILTAVEAAMALRRRHGPERPELVECQVTAWHEKTLSDGPVLSPSMARVSLRYCVACIFLYGDLSSERFSETALHDADVQSLMAKIRISVVDDLPITGSFPCRIQAWWPGSSRWDVEEGHYPTGFIDRSTGVPWDLLRDKFLEVLDPIRPQDAGSAVELFELARRPSEVRDEGIFLDMVRHNVDLKLERS